jgi:hypothetical protein
MIPESYPKRNDPKALRMLVMDYAAAIYIREDSSDIIDQTGFGLTNSVAARVKLRHDEVVM